MRGPSSSHCAGALRIGRICRDLMGGEIKNVSVFMDPNGSLATTHESQGSDMGLMGGLMGWDTTDDRLPVAGNHLAKNGMTLSIGIRDIAAMHPNTYRLVLDGPQGSCQLTALSTGGGMIEITEIDGTGLSIEGDYHETLIFCDPPEPVLQVIKEKLVYDDILVHPDAETIIQVRSQDVPGQAALSYLLKMKGVRLVRNIRPVLPVLSRRDMEVPFLTAGEMLEFNRERGLPLWELALQYESQRAGIPKEEVFEKMKVLAGYMEAAVSTGIKGTRYADRILGSQSPAYKSKMDQGQLLGGDLTNRIIMYTSAVMEVKSAMGLIVAAPTAGSCGTIPGAVLGTAAGMNLPNEQVIKALLAAGMIGIFIARHATFAAESGGCQAECGSASGMAAAALVSLAEGSLEQSLAAASLALQNSLGMICDPIANRVEAPCLGKNIMAAMNALACANMALAGYDHLIPLDEVIQTMKEVGASLPGSL
ncbi:MAG: L-serine ammonia-lyase, iron-sulfur-dependent, subunit alpha, partial [Bacteroidales bacterium]|nr:L-serine ammonia-lyase, iron-sulfur-dependent, subunit alpha [Bacteroidales bacterium]